MSKLYPIPTDKLRSPWRMAPSCATHRAKAVFDTHKIKARIAELYAEQTDNLPDFNPESDLYRGP